MLRRLSSLHLSACKKRTGGLRTFLLSSYFRAPAVTLSVLFRCPASHPPLDTAEDWLELRRPGPAWARALDAVAVNDGFKGAVLIPAMMPVTRGKWRVAAKPATGVAQDFAPFVWNPLRSGSPGCSRSRIELFPWPAQRYCWELLRRNALTQRLATLPVDVASIVLFKLTLPCVKSAAGIPDGGKVLANRADHSQFVKGHSLSMTNDRRRVKTSRST